jgi:hypothetical protein
MPGGQLHTPFNGLGVLNPNKTVPTKLAGECPGGKTSVLFLNQECVKQ